MAGSLKLNTVHATCLIQASQRSGRPTVLGRTIGEIGRLFKTCYLLAHLDDESYRRRILIQLNRGETRRRLARAIFYGKPEELYHCYREGQEDQLSTLGMVMNAIILGNMHYTEAADLARLSPLGYDHLTIVGRYSFTVPDAVAQGHLRP